VEGVLLLGDLLLTLLAIVVLLLTLCSYSYDADADADADADGGSHMSHAPPYSLEVSVGDRCAPPYSLECWIVSLVDAM